MNLLPMRCIDVFTFCVLLMLLGYFVSV